MVRRYLLGACLGTLIGSQIVLSLNMQLVPLIIGLSIIMVTWLPRLPTDNLSGKYFSFGTVFTLLSTLAGASGPIASAFLSREGLTKDSLITTIGAFVATSHLFKVIAFFLLGFAFAPYFKLILLMSISVVVGSWLGTKLRNHLPEFSFHNYFRWLITILAARMIWLSVSHYV